MPHVLYAHVWWRFPNTNFYFLRFAVLGYTKKKYCYFTILYVRVQSKLTLRVRQRVTHRTLKLRTIRGIILFYIYLHCFGKIYYNKSHTMKYFIFVCTSISRIYRNKSVEPDSSVIQNLISTTAISAINRKVFVNSFMFMLYKLHCHLMLQLSKKKHAMYFSHSN